MKYLLLIFIITFSCINCAAQNRVHTMHTNNGHQIQYISSNTFEDSKVNGKINVKSITNTKNIDDVINQIGQPIEVKKEKDTAVDGTILFERKLLIYPGLLLVFPKKNGEYRLSRIDFTSSQAMIEIAGHEISTGKKIEEISDFLSEPEEINGRINIQVIEKSKIKKSNIDQSDVNFNDKSIKIEYDTDTKKITGISLLMYSV